MSHSQMVVLSLIILFVTGLVYNIFKPFIDSEIAEWKYHKDKIKSHQLKGRHFVGTMKFICQLPEGYEAAKIIADGDKYVLITAPHKAPLRVEIETGAFREINVGR